MNRFSKAALFLAGGMLLAVAAGALPAGTAITYQGRLSDAGTAANGIYDLRFGLWDDPSVGAQVAPAITNAGVIVSNGFFTAALDFGPTAFDGNARWLEVAVRAGAGDYTILSPRQAVTPAPYALMAANLGQNALTATTNGIWVASTNWVAAQGFQLTNGLTRKAICSPLPSNGSNYVVDFSCEAVQIAATNHLSLTQSINRPASGWYGESVWYIQGGVTNWTLRTNPNWTPIGTLATNVPYVILSNKLTILALSARGDSETNVSYAIGRQE